MTTSAVPAPNSGGGTPNNTAGIVIRLAGWRRNHCSIPGRRSLFFFSPKRPGRLLGPDKPVIYSYEDLFFLGVKVAGTRS